MIIYRFEGSDGNGLYNEKLYKGKYLQKFKEMTQRHEAFNRSHPRGRTVPNFKHGVHYFGFNSIPKLKQWFNIQELLFLRNAGIVLKVYSVNNKNTISDEYQTVFEKDQAKFVKYIDIMKLI